MFIESGEAELSLIIMNLLYRPDYDSCYLPVATTGNWHTVLMGFKDRVSKSNRGTFYLDFMKFKYHRRNWTINNFLHNIAVSHLFPSNEMIDVTVIGELRLEVINIRFISIFVIHSLKNC